MTPREAIVLVVAMLEVGLLVLVPGIRDTLAHSRMRRTMATMREVGDRLEDPSVPPPTDVLDGWGAPLRVGRLAPVASSAEPLVVLVSAGADRIFEEASLERSASLPFTGTLHDDADIVRSGDTWMRYPSS